MRKHRRRERLIHIIIILYTEIMSRQQEDRDDVGEEKAAGRLRISPSVDSATRDLDSSEDGEQNEVANVEGVDDDDMKIQRMKRAVNHGGGGHNNNNIRHDENHNKKLQCIPENKTMAERVVESAKVKSNRVNEKNRDDSTNTTSAVASSPISSTPRTFGRRRQQDDDFTSRRQHGIYSRVGAFPIRGMGSDGTGYSSSRQLTMNNYGDVETTTTQEQQQHEEEEDVFVSAFMVVEVDEEMLAKRAEKNARENILHEMVQGEVVEPQKESGDDSNRRNRAMIFIGFILVVVITVVVVTVAVSFNDDQPGTAADVEHNQNETTIPVASTDYDYLVEILSPISGRDLLLNETSSQNNALYWILEQDDFFNINNNTAIQSIPESILIERYILAVLYFTTQGDNWSQNISFLSNTSVCEWHPEDHNVGVQCNANEQVIDINLPTMNLNGVIPAELGFLRFLRNLYLDQNLLQGSIPDSLSQLDQLVQFSISSNYITGSIPDFFTKLNKLELLYLPHNYITGTLPRDIFQIDTLTHFSAGENHLTGTISEFVVGGKLEILELDFNMLEGSIPESLYTNNEIFALSLYGNNLTSALSNLIGNLNRMVFLYIDGNHLHGSLPTELGLLTSVEFMWLNNNDFTGTIPSEIGDLAKFKVLSELLLGGTQLSGEVPSELGLFTSIFTIDIANTSISGDLDPVFCENEAFSVPTLRADCGGECYLFMLYCLLQ